MAKLFGQPVPVEKQWRTWGYFSLAIVLGMFIGWLAFGPSKATVTERQLGSINDIELKSIDEFQKAVETRKALDTKLDGFTAVYTRQVQTWEQAKAKAAAALLAQVSPEAIKAATDSPSHKAPSVMPGVSSGK